MPIDSKMECFSRQLGDSKRGSAAIIYNDRSKLQGGLHSLASLALLFLKELVPSISWCMVAWEPGH